MPFEYYSTRSADKPVSFEHAIIEGLAPDGGLYLPEYASKAPADFETKWANLSFEELAFEIMKLYVPESEIPHSDLKELIAKSYSTFRSKDVTPLIEFNKSKNMYLLELFHGPTYAFKDVALQFLGNLFEYFLTRRNSGKAADAADRETITVVGATSGDTGSAAIYGLRGKKDVDVFITYPTGRVSPIQEQQMTTVLDENVRTISVPGTFDDCQSIVKALFSDREFNGKYHLGAVNSINWARILSQMTYYFKAYFALPEAARADKENKPVFVVPSGNFGDILAGFYAREMGLPIQLVIATNSNDILYRFVNSGDYAKGNDVYATYSPAMDILVSSNFERFLWHAAKDTVANGDRVEAGKIIKQWMDELKEKGSFVVPESVLKKTQEIFGAQHASDDDTISAMRNTYGDLHEGYVADPHTAVGIHSALLERKEEKNTSPKSALVVLSTAHPAKFSEAVTAALSDEADFDFQKEVFPAEFHDMMNAKNKKIFAKSNTVDEIKNIIIDELK